MKAPAHPIYLTVIFLLLAILAIIARRYLATRGELADTTRVLSRLDHAYRTSIEWTSRGVAHYQREINRATYMRKEMPELNPQPVQGYPVCQLGCVTSISRVEGFDVDAESLFIKTYNDELTNPKIGKPRITNARLLYPRPVHRIGRTPTTEYTAFEPAAR